MLIQKLSRKTNSGILVTTYGSSAFTPHKFKMSDELPIVDPAKSSSRHESIFIAALNLPSHKAIRLVKIKS